MRITVIPRGEALSRRGGPYALRRLRSAFARLAPELRRVELRLFDVNGPKGGVDKSCRLEVNLRRGRKPIFVEGTAATLSESVDLAIRRAKHVVTKSLEKRGEPRREARRGSRRGRS